MQGAAQGPGSGAIAWPTCKGLLFFCSSRPRSVILFLLSESWASTLYTNKGTDHYAQTAGGGLLFSHLAGRAIPRVFSASANSFQSAAQAQEKVLLLVAWPQASSQPHDFATSGPQLQSAAAQHSLKSARRSRREREDWIVKGFWGATEFL